MPICDITHVFNVQCPYTYTKFYERTPKRVLEAQCIKYNLKLSHLVKIFRLLRKLIYSILISALVYAVSFITIG